MRRCANNPPVRKSNWRYVALVLDDAPSLVLDEETPRFRLYPKRTLAVHCDSNDATGEPMQYFEASDGKLERIGKVIGDTISALVILSVLILAFNTVFR
jgi:hypothetical protein